MIARRWLLAPALLALFASPGAAADVVAPPASERFKKESAEEVPSFQRHVLPLLGRLGCNGRACHGSFQGQGGFRLSLFGYDFKADHDALVGGAEPRANVKTPADSLILTKPTLAEPHKGGKRMPAGGWEYNLLLNWVKAGAPGANDKDAAFATLEVEPQGDRLRQAGRQSRSCAWSRAGPTARARTSRRCAASAPTTSRSPRSARPVK